MSPLTLFGYRYSVYTRIVLLVLQEKGLDYTYREVDPFSDAQEQVPHPFGRVPTLRHDGHDLYETAAITRYLDAAFPEPKLTPAGALGRARMTQVISIIDAYGYWPMVRQVFEHDVFRPLMDDKSDAQEVALGLNASQQVLCALEDIAKEGLVLSPQNFTLACAHLAPMLDYMAQSPDGWQTMRHYPKLMTWFNAVRKRPSFQATHPDL